MLVKILNFRTRVPLFPRIRRNSRRGPYTFYKSFERKILCRAAFVGTIILQNQHFNKIYPENRKFLRKYEISGNLKIYITFGLQLQVLHLSYTNVLYVILKGTARGTTFVWNIFPKFIILMRRNQKTSFGGTVTPPGIVCRGFWLASQPQVVIWCVMNNWAKFQTGY